MKRLLDGLSRFQNEVFPEHRGLFSRLASSQSPEALFLTCSDSRIVPDLLTQTKPGDLFICRNAGNIAPPYGEATGGVSATIEYAVLALGVSDIIVCGHSDCGVMKSLLSPQKVEHLPAVSAWLRHGEAARLIVEENYPGFEGRQLTDFLAKQNALQQIANLRTHPCVAAREAGGKLTLYAWFFEIDTGKVLVHVPARREFVPLASVIYEQAGAAGEREVHV